MSPLGDHGQWREIWIIPIYGEEGSEGHDAYLQYVKLAKDHPWVHPLWFENVRSGPEAAEDITYLTFPQPAGK